MVQVDSKTKAGSHGIFKKTAYLLSAQWIREALQTGFLIFLARKYTTTYGEFMVAVNMGQILLFIAEFGLNQHLATLLARKEEKQTGILLQITLLKAGLLFIAWAGMVGFIFWQGYEPHLKKFVLLIGTGVGLEALASSFFVACQVKGRQDVEGKLRSISATMGFGYGIIGIWTGIAPIFIALFKIIETFFNIGGGIVLSLRQVRWKSVFTGFDDIWKTWRGGIIYTLMAVAAIFYNKINIFFLQKYGGAEGVAQYSATWQMVDGISILVSGTLLRRVLFPLFLKLWVKDREEFVELARNSARWLLAAAGPIMFILFIESDRIIGLVYGDEFVKAAHMQKYLVGAVLFAFMHNLAAYLMISFQSQRLLLVFYVTGLAVNLVLCMTLIPQHPLLGTALAIVLTKGFVASLTVGFCQIRLRIISWNTVYMLLLTGAACTALYFAGGLLRREVAEVLALIPVVVLAIYWKKSLTGKVEKIKS